ncbi:DNA polymerase III subunit delta' [Sphingomonas sp. ID0503]|uniref:DNA polymerase III subunit delta' n=1 Tax=Sphingomonas sp. ID0503 TaxID=3399691 RepID=UPI003AFAA300
MTTVTGHADQIAAFREALDSGRVHHAWLLAGPAGVGKATFARAAALRLLAEAAGPKGAWPGLDVPSDHRIAVLMEAGSHPDLKILERLPKERGDGLARSITVDQARGLGRMFGLTPSLSAARVVIVDAADDLERGAANALLKNLEEPPAGTIFLLVSHAPGRLLPTIRSRCRVLRFGPLSDGDTAAVLRHTDPGLSGPEVEALVRIANGSPGRAFGFAGLDIAGLDTVLAELSTVGDPHNEVRVRLSRALGPVAAQARYEAFLERAPAHIAETAGRRQGMALQDAIKLWERSRDLAGAARGLSLPAESVTFEMAGIVAALAL